ncbi:MAG: hypothetical protein ACFFFH_13830 [Candidatus Thorarchaeota archaeon]
MQKNEEVSSAGAQKGRFLFATIFTIVFPIFTLLSPLPIMIFNLLFLPFTIVHELGHLLVISLLLPFLNPQLEFYLFDGVFCCACLTTNEFPHCWQTIIVMLAGSFSVLSFSLFCCFALFKVRSGDFYVIGKYYFIFGLLADLPNLLPILPSSLGFTTDGFAINTCLYQMGYSLLISDMMSHVFSLISIIMVLASFFFLGSFFYRLGEIVVRKFEKENEIGSVCS